MFGDELLRIACAQVPSSPDKEENLALIERLATRSSSANADMLVFPEVYMFYSPPGESNEERGSKSESLDGQFVGKIRDIARKNEISITIGLYESSKESRPYNTTMTTDSKGEILNIYRKTHLYDAFNFKESDRLLSSDNQPQVFEYRGFKIGTIVCYEVRFPEMTRTLALRGAEVVIIPSAWVRGYNKEDNWMTLVKARAMENTVYIATSNQIGNTFTGISVFVDPLGIILERADDEEGMIVGEVRKSRLKRAREILPVLAQRKTSVYDL